VSNLAQEISAEFDVGVGFDAFSFEAVDHAEDTAPRLRRPADAPRRRSRSRVSDATAKSNRSPSYLQPVWATRNPLFDCGGCSVHLQFAENGLRDDHTSVQFSQNVSVVQEDEIMQRSGIGDDDHRRWSSLLRVSRRYRLVSASNSKSSTV
jgi:hypothetical protein